MLHSNFRRVMAILLCLLMMSSALIACAKDSGQPSATTPAAVTTAVPDETEPAETKLTSSVTPIDMGNNELSIITRAPYAYMYPYHEILAEETTGDLLNDAIRKRNMIIEDRYNCTLVVHATDKDDIVNMVNQVVLSNNGEFDIIVSSVKHNVTWAQKQYLVEMHEYDDIVQFEQPWWMGHIMDATSLSGKNFFCPSDVNIAAFHAIGITYFNKKVAEENKIENLYDLVREGKWTFDKMNTLCTDIYSDLNGSQSIDAEDAFGMALNSYSWQPLFYGGGGLMIVKNADDVPELVSTKESTINYLEKLVNFANASGYVFNANHYGYGGTQLAEKFRDGQSLFYIEASYSLPNLRNMEVDFGVLPMPKASEAQEDYISSIHIDHSSAMSVPVSNFDFELTASLLEDMAFYSYHNIRPVFIEQMIKTRDSRDADSGEMFDYIYEHVVLDLALVFSNKIGIDGDVRDCFNNGGQIASTMAMNFNVYSKLLERSVKAMLEGS